MIDQERVGLVDWLRENCIADPMLLELVDDLANAGRDDLLSLVRDFRLPPELSEAELERRSGSALELERKLYQLNHSFFRPIFERHRDRAAAEAVYNRLGADWPEDYVHKLISKCEESHHDDLRLLLACALEIPRLPLNEIPKRLHESLERVIALIFDLRDAHKLIRKGGPGSDERSLS